MSINKEIPIELQKKCVNACTDGTLWAAGDNRYGELGIGNTTSHNTFVQVPASGPATMARGFYHNLSIDNNGTLSASGDNQYGQFGTGVNGTSTTFSPVLSGVAQAACGDGFSSAIKNDGTLWSAGLNDCGELGLASNNNTNV